MGALEGRALVRGTGVRGFFYYAPEKNSSSVGAARLISVKRFKGGPGDFLGPRMKLSGRSD